jgi:hypothetical protein
MKNNFMTKINGTINKVGFQLRKHSPEILVVTGVVGTVASAVLACKATLKVNDVVEDTRANIDKIHTSVEKGHTESGAEYNVEDSKKDLSLVYVQTGIKIAKLYAPAVALGGLSIASILASNNILRKRNVAIAAAYATVDKSFKDYRNRVIERFGEEIDRELKYNIKAKEVEETIVNEDGKEEPVKVMKQYVDPTDVSGYARFFEEYTRDEQGNVCKNPYWDKNNEYNFVFLKAQQRYANDLLRSKKRLFLNEVYDMLGLPRTKAGQVVGWVYDPDMNAIGDNYVDFGIFAASDNYSDFIYGNDSILLDFNVDGNVWDDM